MGVQNLWMLLAPVGRQIEIETLSNQVLAVDASIWLTQFIKAMRDDEGNMIKNAHLIGTFHRVAKLLFYRIRPVFVFDGNTPEIKKRTVARRRKRQENQAANLRQTAQRILLNRLKLYREELKKNGGKPSVNPAIDPSFFIPDAAPVDAIENEETKESEADDQVITIDESDEGSEKESAADTTSTVDEVVLESKEESKSDGESDEREEELNAEDIELDLSSLSRLDLDAVFALPPHLQKEMVERIQRERRQEARDLFIPLAGNPEAYSRTQIASFLKTSKLNAKLAKARQKSVQQEMEKSAAASGRTASEDTGTALLGHGKRIASSSDRFYILEKAKKRSRDDESDVEDGGEETARKNTEFHDTQWFNTRGSQDFTSEDDEDIFDRIHGSKRRRHNLDEDKVILKKTLSEFSASNVDEFVAEMGRSQRRKMAVEARKQEFLEKQRLKEVKKQAALEPKTTRPVVVTGSKAESKGDEPSEGITITIKKVDLALLDKKAEELFPESMFEPAASSSTNMQAKTLDDDDEDVDWEDVAPAKEAEDRVSDKTKMPSLPATEEQQPLPIVGTASSAVQEAKRTSNEVNEVAGSSEDDETQWEDVLPMPVTQALPAPSKDVSSPTKTTQQAIELSDSDADELVDDADELYKSLQVELEEEKAEEDLNVLKQEALQSAIATATNLTQWAAGAVRRALAQHTKQVDMKNSPLKTSTPDRGQTPRVAQSMPNEEAVIDLSEETESPQVEMETEPGVDQSSDDHALQLAIEKSMHESTREKPSGASRYLQYNAPETEPEPDINVTAITEEQLELKKLRNRQMRDVEGVNDEMVEEVMELLRLFGVPYLVCPMEAEAQCAALEQLGLVNGIITDDSDIFPFGGKKIYKNIFHNQKFVEAFSAEDVKNELGFTQDEMITLALLLGSDYTDGVRGIGIVNASEVVAAYPGLDGLKAFKEWVLSFDVAEEARRRLEKKKTQAELDKMTPRERFEYTHANVRRKWELGEEFPNDRVIQAYKSPQVDRSDGRFTWEPPDLAGLREYCTKEFGWDQGKADIVLLPLMEQLESFANNRQVQTRIDQFFTKYEDNVKYAKIQSKRLRLAVEGKTGRKQESTEEPRSPTKSPARVVKKGKFTKTKKTTSTLGM